MLALASFVCGLIFGWGLLISGMTQPEKVLGFLDVFGRWDPTMGFVMAGALAISALGFVLVKRRIAPIFAAQSLWPSRTDIDRRLVAGAVLFGAGWGMVGLCPGPALENLATLSPRVIVFVVAMAAGMVLQDLWQQRTPSPAKLQDAALATSPDG
jgi:uncharacterized membrane protein YedE/YeeE